MANQNRAIEFGLLFSLPSTAALWILAEPMIRVLFEHGKFGPDDTQRTAGALAAYAVGLPAFMLVKALTPGFFAREDTRTPLYTAIVVDRGQRRAERLVRAGHAARTGRHRALLVALGLAECGAAGGRAAAPRALAARRPPHLAHLADGGRDHRHGRRAGRGPHRAAGRPLAHPDLVGALALLGLCAAGGVVYGAVGAALGVVKLSEIRFMLRRQPGVKPDDPAAPP